MVYHTSLLSAGHVITLLSCCSTVNVNCVLDGVLSTVEDNDVLYGVLSTVAVNCIFISCFI